MEDTMKQHYELLDGGIGTSLWEKAKDRVLVWRYNVEDPAIVTELHKEFIAAGSKIILANTFGANADALCLSHTDYKVEPIVREGVCLAKDAAKGTGVKVALAAGQLTGLMKPYGTFSEEDVFNIYDEQIGSGMKEHPDLVVLQTFVDLDMMTIAVKAARQYDVPVFSMITYQKNGKTIMGQSVSDTVKALEPLGVSAVGMNCTITPDQVLPIVKQFKECTDLPVLLKPNAGKPILADDDKTTSSPCSPEDFARDIQPATQYADYVGGCCGCNASYIRAIADLRDKNA